MVDFFQFLGVAVIWVWGACVLANIITGLTMGNTKYLKFWWAGPYALLQDVKSL